LVVNDPQKWASDLCEIGVIGPYPQYETPVFHQCKRPAFPDGLVSLRIDAPKATKVGISAFAKINFVGGSEEALLFVSVDGARVRSERVTLRQQGKLPTFLLTRLVPVSAGIHEITLGLLTGSEEMAGVNVYTRGIKTAEGEIPAWSNWVPRSVQLAARP